MYFCRLLLVCTSLSISLDFYFYSCRRHTPRRAQPSFVISSHFAPRRVLRHAMSCFLQYKTTVDVMKILIENSKFRPEPLPWAHDAITSCHLNGKRSSAFYVVFEDMMDWTLQCTYITLLRIPSAQNITIDAMAHRRHRQTCSLIWTRKSPLLHLGAILGCTWVVMLHSKTFKSVQLCGSPFDWDIKCWRIQIWPHYET